MKMILILILGVATLVPARAAQDAPEDLWERAVVTVEVTRKQYEYFQPWSKKVDQVQKMGVILPDHDILTTADYLGDSTLIRLQKGRGRWFPGKIAWVDYHANLALISCGEKPFWEGTKAMEIEQITPRRGTVQLVRWRGGSLEVRNTDINRLLVKKSKLSFIDLPFLELDSEMAGVGWAEIIVRDDKIIGVTSSKEEHSITVIPSYFIRHCLADRKKEPYQGLGYFPFIWQPGENPATMAYLGLEGEPRGVIVAEVNTNKNPSPLQPRDVILKIDGFDIDVQGDYKDPDYGNMLLENLATRNKNAGEGLKMKIFRAGKEMDITYVLPKAEYGVEMVPMGVFDQEPDYYIMGGLLFQPLTVPYLQSWGADWARKAPFRLSYATKEPPRPDKYSYVVLSMILPDPVNIGYQDARFLLVETLNGQRINTLRDLIAAKDKAQNGFHLLEFKEGDSLKRLVLDATEVDAATERALKNYGIPKDRSLSEPSTARLTAQQEQAGGGSNVALPAALNQK
jgi:hypothetical protein